MLLIHFCSTVDLFCYSLLFWSDWGTESKIVSATMLGEKVNTLVNSGLLEPKGLVVDYENARWRYRNFS